MYITKGRLIVIGLIFIGLIVAIGFYTGQHLKDKRQSNNEDEILFEFEFESEGVNVSAEELMSHYRRDAYGANKKYSDDSIQPGVPRITLPPGHVPKSIIVKGKIKRIDKEDLSHIGFVNQYKTTVTLWGEDVGKKQEKMTKIKNEIETKIENETKDIEDNFDRSIVAAALTVQRGWHEIKFAGDEVRCSFRRDQTYSLRHLNTDDFVEIRGNVVSNSLGTYVPFWYYLNIENCVLIDHRSNSEDKDDASISTD